MSWVLGYGTDVPVVYVLGDEYEVVSLDDENELRIVGLPEPFRILALHPASQIDRKARARPLISGISVGHAMVTAGTLGWFARYNGKSVMVSNAHVLHPNPCSDRAPIVMDIVQPGSYDGGVVLRDTVAYYHSHIPVGNGESDCIVARTVEAVLNAISRALGRKTRFKAYAERSNDVDIALATLIESHMNAVLQDNGLPVDPSKEGWRLAGFAFAGGGTRMVFCKVSNILKYYPGLDFGVDVADPKPGDRVLKCGRTTGCTYGDVETASAYVKVSGYPCGEVLFSDVAVAVGRIAGGDSGS
ncbi:MAG: hypothetical protein QXX25_08460, partial [Thermofilaceae archaeon]